MDRGKVAGPMVKDIHVEKSASEFIYTKMIPLKEIYLTQRYSPVVVASDRRLDSLRSAEQKENADAFPD